MQVTLFGAVAPKRLRRFARAQNDLIWTAADATELDLAAAPNGGRCGYQELFTPLAIPTTAKQTCGPARIFMQRRTWRECPLMHVMPVIFLLI